VPYVSMVLQAAKVQSTGPQDGHRPQPHAPSLMIMLRGVDMGPLASHAGLHEFGHVLPIAAWVLDTPGPATLCNPGPRPSCKIL
jgi:hypothetical protein